VTTIAALVLTSLLAADPPAAPATPAASAPAPAAAPAPPPALVPAPAPEKKGNYLRLAAPVFAGVNVDPKVASFFSEHFAGALVRHGLLVLTASEINAMIGLERSKQLAGCTEEATACVAELSNALGVEGLVVGTVAKFGTTLQANIKVFQASSGASIKAISVKATGEEAFLDALSKEAAVVAPDLLQRVGRETAPTLEVEAKGMRVNIVSLGALPALLSAFLYQFGQFYSLEYERVLADWVGIYAAPTVITFQLPQDTFLPKGPPPPNPVRAPFRANFFRLELGGRFYWPGKGPGGWWASPAVGVGAGEVGAATLHPDTTVTVETRAGLDFSAGLSVGYRWYPAEYIPITVGLGGEWHSSELIGLPNVRLHIGFAW
jgi:hypothetical protein